jgi:hypothetical protein
MPRLSLSLFSMIRPARKELAVSLRKKLAVALMQVRSVHLFRLLPASSAPDSQLATPFGAQSN